jgi:hypothetical protein
VFLWSGTRGLRFLCSGRLAGGPGLPSGLDGHRRHLQRPATPRAWAPHELEAREKGIPHLGAGAIYPVPGSVYLIDPFQIPDHWPRVYGLDVGGKTACVWGAWDREHDLLVLDGEYYREEKEDAEPSLHAEAIKKPGKWIPGVIDPAARGRSQTDGRRSLQMYKDLGLDVEPADNSVETGIYRVWTRLQSGRLKIFHAKPAHPRIEALPPGRKGPRGEEKRPLDGRNAVSRNERTRPGEDQTSAKGIRDALPAGQALRFGRRSKLDGLRARLRREWNHAEEDSGNPARRPIGQRLA